MKQLLVAFFLILGISIAYAGSMMLLKVGDAAGNGGAAPVNCGDGTIDLSTGCVQPMLGF